MSDSFDGYIDKLYFYKDTLIRVKAVLNML